MNVRLVDNEHRFQKGRLFRFDEAVKQDVDVTEDHPDVHQRLSAWEQQWLDSVKTDQAAYNVDRR